jgi:hypothetical protein
MNSGRMSMLNTMPLAVPDEQSMMPHTWHVVMAANRTSGSGDQLCTINKFNQICTNYFKHNDFTSPAAGMRGGYGDRHCTNNHDFTPAGRLVRAHDTNDADCNHKAMHSRGGGGAQLTTRRVRVGLARKGGSNEGLQGR